LVSHLIGFGEWTMDNRFKANKMDIWIGIAFNVQPILLKIGLFLITFLIIIQVFNYFYCIKDVNIALDYAKGFISINNIIQNSVVIDFKTKVKKGDVIIVKVNGIPAKRIESNKPARVNVSSMDVLEIDATNTHGTYEVIIEAKPSHYLPENYKKIIITAGKLYRLPPLY